MSMWIVLGLIVFGAVIGFMVGKIWYDMPIMGHYDPEVVAELYDCLTTGPDIIDQQIDDPNPSQSITET